MKLTEEIFLHRPVYVVGDIHQKFSELKDRITYLCNSDIFLLGDCGFFTEEHLNEFGDIVGERASINNIRIFCIRGNHDNPYLWKMNKSGIEENWLSNGIIPVQDGQIFRHETGKIGAAFGGSLSIDRVRRTLGLDYFSGEKVDYSLIDEIDSPLLPVPDGKLKYNFLLSHVGITPPSLGAGSGIFNHFMNVDTKLPQDIYEEREFCNAMCQITENWFYGHYHVHQIFGYFGCECNALEELEIKKIL